jgi:quercetin dioxygenase-like cupin family protein
MRVGPASVAGREPRVAVLVGGEETGGRFALVETLEERGAGLPLHLHHWEDEALYVLEGSLDVWVAGGWVGVPAGVAVFLARGVEHALVSATGRARVISLYVPAGFEGFHREMDSADPASRAVERMVATAARYGCEITGPAPVRPEAARHSGVRVNDLDRTKEVKVRTE